VTGGRLTAEVVIAVRRQVRTGATCAELAPRLGVTARCLQEAVTGRRWASVDPIEPPVPVGQRNGRAGESNGNARLRASQVRALRTLRARGVPLRELAARYGISYRTAKKVSCGESWAHVR
jgi:hypothetical protein